VFAVVVEHQSVYDGEVKEIVVEVVGETIRFNCLTQLLAVATVIKLDSAPSAMTTATAGSSNSTKQL